MCFSTWSICNFRVSTQVFTQGEQVFRNTSVPLCIAQDFPLGPILGCLCFFSTLCGPALVQTALSINQWNLGRVLSRSLFWSRYFPSFVLSLVLVQSSPSWSWSPLSSLSSAEVRDRKSYACLLRLRLPPTESLIEEGRRHWRKMKWWFCIYDDMIFWLRLIYHWFLDL